MTVAHAFALSAAPLALAAALSSTPAHAADRAAEVRYTAYGVAHVKADDFEGVGYGYGWAYARDNLCLAVDHAITLAGERSMRIGPDATYFDGFANLGGGLQVNNFDSDVFFRTHLTPAATKAARAYASADMRALVKGFVRGFNKHASETALPGEDCRRAAWFRPLTEADIWRRVVHVPILETSNLLLEQIARAAPPGATVARIEPSDPEPMAGSNAAAFGRKMTAWGGGLSFSNPHFPWDGIERLHAVQLTVPGKYNVFGATLYNLPVPMLGFNESMGWSITYTTDQHATVYQLELDPKSPTRYMVDGHSEAMTAVTVAVPVKTGTGIETRKRKLWRTRYGWMMALPGFEWTDRRAYSIADAENGNVRLADAFLDVGKAKTVDVVKAALDRHMAFPWSNLTAADSTGQVLYANISLTPDIDDAKLARCRVTVDAQIAPTVEYVAAILKGSDSTCGWGRDPAAVQPGTVPASRRPSMIRDDFVLNSNDSHWLATWESSATLDGYAATIGNERTLRGERTRMGIIMALGRRDGSDGLGAPGIDAGKWEALFFRSRNLMAELLLDDTLADCRVRPVVDLADGGKVDLTQACSILARWDRTDRPDARGSTLFREFMLGLERLPETGFKLAARYWKVPFDPANPIATPRGLKVSDETRTALARAVLRMSRAGIAIDAPLREVQFASRNGARLPLSGSSYTYHMLVDPIRANPGDPQRLRGDSYIHVVELRPEGPRGRFMVTYSQSTNPRSPHFGDLTTLYSSQTLADVAFTPPQVEAEQVGETVRLSY
ncbi:penicillin acylase family protein [Sphingopyxis granuli]|uniref:penicillin acylase family protein n=1 Tax=Sphingopyxis granuli TaxID=267128 RepID=UPI001F5382B4|nr:penicillin acylase family protein [Sphingopyxis granuli]UNK80064.1 penicillin acylase family protein [Sphingopyxis granuli]